MAKWPLLLTGKYSVKPCSSPKMRAWNSVMNYLDSLFSSLGV